MKLLIDTHILIWWLDGDSRLLERNRRLLRSGDHEVFVSAVTAWEIATKTRLGKLQFDADFIDDFEQRTLALNMVHLSVAIRHAVVGAQLSGQHSDPFDRLLAAQAIVEGLRVLTADPAIKALGAPAIW